MLAALIGWPAILNGIAEAGFLIATLIALMHITGDVL